MSLENVKVVENIKSMELEKLLFLVVSGSRAYGTNIPGSDWDFRGVFANTKEEVIGLLTRDAQVYDGEDATLHGLTKFAKLAMDNNPNVLELLFIQEGALHVHPLFKKWFLDNRLNFLSQKCYYTYSGYAISQVKRNKHKSSHGILRDKYIMGPDDDPYDSKFAMHTVRLMLNGMEILSNGTLTPMFKGENLEFLKNIREGKYFKNASEFYEWVEEYDSKMKLMHESVKKTGSLPRGVDQKYVSSLLIEFYEEFWNYK